MRKIAKRKTMPDARASVGFHRGVTASNGTFLRIVVMLGETP
jgi:hypothetical protein